MKHALYLLLGALLIQGCAPTASIDSFYNRHKEDPNVLAFRVPPVMFSLLSNLSPEMGSVIGNTTDLRYIRLPASGASEMMALNRQVSQLTSGSFIEVFRKNEGDQRNLVAIRERGNTVRNILIYNNNAAFGSVLYIKGRFDPERVRNLANEDAFGTLEQQLTRSFSGQAPTE